MYFSGFLGDVQLLMFRGNEITRPDGEVVQTWRLFVQERDPSRRPGAKKPETASKQPSTAGEAALAAAGRGSELVTTPIPAGGDPIDDII
jgi:hypothetical protein